MAWIYSETMLIYDAAKAIGFDKFTPSALSQWLTTTNGFPLPLSHNLVNPGPKAAPQIKQPYVRRSSSGRTASSSRTTGRTQQGRLDQRLVAERMTGARLHRGGHLLKCGGSAVTQWRVSCRRQLGYLVGSSAAAVKLG